MGYNRIRDGASQASRRAYSVFLSLSLSHAHSHTQFDKFVFLRILVLSLIRKDLALLLVLPAYPCSLSQLNLLSQISQLLGMLSNLFTVLRFIIDTR